MAIYIAMCSLMEVLAVHAKAYLSIPTPEGFTTLHCAAIRGNTGVCNLLAAEVRMGMHAM